MDYDNWADGQYGAKPENIFWCQDYMCQYCWSEFEEEGALQNVDFGVGLFDGLCDSYAGCTGGILGSVNPFGNWMFDNGLEWLEKDGSRPAPKIGWVGWALEARLRMRHTHRRLAWHEINVWWHSKIESLLGSRSSKQPETVFRSMKVFKSLLRFSRGANRRTGQLSLLSLPYILTWATPVAAELSIRENMGSSFRPRISSAYGDLQYEIEKFLLVSTFPS